ncbi:MAG: ABC transporter permease [Deltaproteobacteria bacterium]|nr:ABC transporter permease [Deltaproteobacteria bacterium]
MGNLFKIALRNLLRYKRRTLLTASLITLGVVFVMAFVSVSGSFKSMMIGQVTDSMIGHLQVHRKGFVASIETLPLNLNLKEDAIDRLEVILAAQPEIASYSPRVKFGAIFSNFTETSSIRVTAIEPEKEFRTVPLLPGRVREGSKDLKQGGILIPELLARGMKVKSGDLVVLVATNADGSVNGKQLIVTGVLESATGPGGRDGYVHQADAMEVLRMEDRQVSEYAIRLKDFGKLATFGEQLDGLLSKELNKDGKPLFELHTWEKLSPFFNIAQMIDLMTFFVKLMLIAIVLISIMNVMIMAVYERIREIGTIAAIGTFPGKILTLFLIEGFCMGVGGALIGNLVGIALIKVLNWFEISYNFGQQQGLILQASVEPTEVVVVSVTVIVVSVIASFQPAFKASRMEPIKALRHT